MIRRPPSSTLFPSPTLSRSGQAVADPHGLALSPDEQWLAVAASGSRELLVYRLPGLPFMDYGGPGDHIDANLLKDRRSEEHTSELQSRQYLVFRLLLEKKKT